jgi:hypothetical protein
MLARLLLAAVPCLVLGCKGDRAKCEKAARNYATLVYWQRADAEIAKLPQDQRDADRKRRLAAFTNELESQIDFFVDQCVNANNDDQIDCMIAAKTGTDASKCADLIKMD